MNSSTVCEICGNEVQPDAGSCPFCLSPLTVRVKKNECVQQRVVNLERGMPLVEQALERLRNELYVCRNSNIRIMTLIHGYGSTGKGGAIRDEVRRYLGFLLHSKEINEIVLGEEFSKHTGKGRQLIRRFPTLAEHRDFNRSNPGVTIVVIL